jgi:hypothetical protein
MKIVFPNCSFLGPAFYLRAALSAGLIALAMLALPPAARADPSSANPVQLHCQATLRSRIREACQDQKIITSAFNVGDQLCDAKPKANNERFNCAVRKANDFIDQAYKQHPKDADDFKKKLTAILTKKGDPSKPGANAGSITDGSCIGGKCFTDEAADPNADCSNDRCDLIKKYVNPSINLLSLCFGVIAAASLIAGGIQYSTSAGDSEKVTRAKKRIFNTLVAVFAYIFMWSFLQFLVPGGVFNR